MINLSIIILLLLLSAFFSASEIALFTFRKTRLALLVKQGNKNALMVNKIMQRPESVLSTILVGNNIVQTVASVLGTVLAIELFQEHGVVIAMVGMTFLTMQLGEILPKLIASQFWEKVAFASVRPIRFFSFIFYPFVAFFSLTTRFFGLILGIRIKYNKPLITKEELRHTIDIVKESGHLGEDEASILHNIFKFADRTVQDVMLEREKVDLLSLNASTEEMLNLITEKHHTRIPIYEGNPDNIVGILYTKDFLNVVCYGQGGLIILQDLMRKPHVVSESQKISKVLSELQKKHIHLAIVNDEHGKFSGIITVEDIIEEIVGEIMDEYDTMNPVRN